MERSFQQIQSLRSKSRTIKSSIILNHSTSDLWSYLADTDMMNLKTGVPPVAYDFKPDPMGGSFMHGTIKAFGMTIEYDEFPYEWLVNDYYIVERFYSKGPLKYMAVYAAIRDQDSQSSRITIEIHYVPRFPFVLLKLMLKMSLKKFIQHFQDIDQSISRDKLEGIGGFIDRSDENLSQAIKLRKEWQDALPNSLISKALAEYIFTAPETLIRKIRPFELAKYYSLNPIETLKFCLSATRQGYLNLSWDILCPSCLGTSTNTDQLGDLVPGTHCETCNIDYDVNFDQNVEITFSPVSRLRKPGDANYCRGGPANTFHIVSQINMDPGQSRSLVTHLDPGEYRMRSLSLNNEIYFSVSPDNHENEINLSLSKEFPKTDKLKLSPQITLNIENKSKHWQTIKIDNLHYRELAAKASLVTSLQDFRDMFDSQVLRPGVQLGVSNVVILFSDLKDSTLLYDRQGDAHAFTLVQDHFDIMTEHIREHSGAVIKTIGDAVMAVYTQGKEAVSSAIDMLKAFNDWNTSHPPEQQIIIKLGIHQGPSIVINLNNTLDYFGATVNKAARVEGTCLGNDIVLSKPLFSDPAVHNFLKKAKDRIIISRFEKKLKGITGIKTFYRIRLKD